MTYFQPSAATSAATETTLRTSTTGFDAEECEVLRGLLAEFIEQACDSDTRAAFLTRITEGTLTPAEADALIDTALLYQEQESQIAEDAVPASATSAVAKITECQSTANYIESISYTNLH